MIRVDYQKYMDFCADACMRAGLRQEVASATAYYLVRTDMLGTYTHGSLNLLPYLKKVETGGIVRDARPEVVSEGSAWAVIEGNNGMGFYNAKVAMDLGMKKAKETGLSYVVVKNSSHYGACGVYAVEGAEKGFITLSASNVAKTMTVPGGKGGIIGNSPFSYAVPAGKYPPVFLDIATSNIAGMKVNRAKTAGEQVPPGSIVDENGLPTTDPNTNWALYPLGGHKGYGIAFFIEVMTSILSGGVVLDIPLWIKSMPTICPYSQMFFFLNVSDMMDPTLFGQRMDDAITQIAQSPKAAGSDRIYLPGDMEWERYQDALQCGLKLPDDIEKNARELAEWKDLDFQNCLK